MVRKSSREHHWEGRAAVRYKLRLPVVFHWNEGCERAECGFTQDIAIDGALIRSRTCPPLGADVRIEVLLAVRAPEREVRIQCLGRVTRVVDENGIKYFGVQGGFDDDQLLREAQK